MKKTENTNNMKTFTVMSKARKHSPSVETEFTVSIIPNKLVQTYRTAKDGTVETGKSFELGDYAEYHSYNLSYYGEIVKITEKSVEIRERYQSKTVHRLDMYTFCWRNFGFDLVKTQQENSDTMMYI
jgi:DNA replication protein DnaD